MNLNLTLTSGVFVVPTTVVQPYHRGVNIMHTDTGIATSTLGVLRCLAETTISKFQCLPFVQAATFGDELFGRYC